MNKSRKQFLLRLTLFTLHTSARWLTMKGFQFLRLSTKFLAVLNPGHSQDFPEVRTIFQISLNPQPSPPSPRQLTPKRFHALYIQLACCHLRAFFRLFSKYISPPINHSFFSLETHIGCKKEKLRCLEKIDFKETSLQN